MSCSPLSSWSDGLGNVNANTLPHCQLQSLLLPITSIQPIRDRHVTEAALRDALAKSELFKHLMSPDQYSPSWDPERIYFWLDTLCIPVSPESSRKHAIRAMKKTYEC